MGKYMYIIPASFITLLVIHVILAYSCYISFGTLLLHVLLLTLPKRGYGKINEIHPMETWTTAACSITGSSTSLTIQSYQLDLCCTPPYTVLKRAGKIAFVQYPICTTYWYLFVPFKTNCPVLCYPSTGPVLKITIYYNL